MLGAKWMDEIEDQRKLGKSQREEENKFKTKEGQGIQQEEGMPVKLTLFYPYLS